MGGVNCGHFVNGVCTSHMANGERWQDFIGIAIACPKEMAFGTKLIVANKTWICKDRGSKIVYGTDGIPWIDFLEEHIEYRYGSIVDAILVSP